MQYRQTCGKCGALRQDDQIGLERTVDAYVARLVAVFHEVKRVLRDDGTLWIVLGDSYYGGKGQNGNSKARRTADERGYAQSGGTVQMATRPLDLPQAGLKPKDLIGIPWRVAFALQADGWWLRSDIIWHKPNCMPESVEDRPTKAHEYIFLLSKSATYFFDQEAIREGLATSTLNDKRNGTGRHTQGQNGSKYFEAGAPDPESAAKPSWYRQKSFVNPASGRNARSVWTITTSGYAGAHFAVMPTEIPRRAILAGSSLQCCAVCGAPWGRVVTKTFVKHPNGLGIGTETKDLQAHQRGRTSSFRTGGSNVATTTGWRPSCRCLGRDGAAPWPDITMHPDGAANWPSVPATVLDPFLGSGTTLAVAVGLGRQGIGIDLNASYIELARARIAQAQPALLAEA